MKAGSVLLAFCRVEEWFRRPFLEVVSFLNNLPPSVKLESFPKQQLLKKTSLFWGFLVCETRWKTRFFNMQSIGKQVILTYNF